MADRGKEEVLEDDEDQEEEDVAVERLDSWFLYVHVREKTITVSCGDASQRIKWLAHVAIGIYFNIFLNGIF